MAWGRETNWRCFLVRDIGGLATPWVVLQRNMNESCASLQSGLDDLLGDLQRARGSGDLGRLALLAYCEVRRWARVAGEQSLAVQSSELIHHIPHPSREAYMAEIDALIAALQQVRGRITGTGRTPQVSAARGAFEASRSLPPLRI